MSSTAKLPLGAPPDSHVAPTVVIQRSQGLLDLDLKDLWHHRELLYFLIWRDVKIRYKQTALGIGWAILQPLIAMVVFTVIFGRFARIPSDNIPYPIFTYTALLPWNYFAGALNRCIQSVVGSANLINKVYFPRLVLPIAGTASGLVDFAFSFLILLGMMVWYGIVPGWGMTLLPIFLFFILLTALAVGLWLSALNVMYRDVGYAVPFLIQIWLFASPVVYPVSLVPEKWRFLYGLNPMAGVIEGFRWALVGNEMPDLGVMSVSLVVVLTLFVGGLFFFRRMERTFADVV